MFETQSLDEWLSPRLRAWRPFFFSIPVTLLAVLVGLSLYSPEGAKLFPGLIIFPYSALLLMAVLATKNEALFMSGLLLMPLQFPVYGLIRALVKNRRTAWIFLGSMHILAMILSLAVLGVMIGLARFGEVLF